MQPVAAAAAAPGTEGGKSKAELKAERRAKQEAQRAAKAASAEEKKDKAPAKAKAQRVPDDMQVGAWCSIRLGNIGNWSEIPIVVFLRVDVMRRYRSYRTFVSLITNV